MCPYATTASAFGSNTERASANPSSLGEAGCRMGRPCSSARSFTGDALTPRPLPRGLSGCVTTAATSCGDSSNARRAGTATSGVPMKTTRITSEPLGGVRARRWRHPEVLIAQCLHGFFPKLGCEAIDEQDAVEVIDLVLEDAREEPFRFLLDRSTGKVLRAHLHRGRARHGIIRAGQRQAALFRFFGTNTSHGRSEAVSVSAGSGFVKRGAPPRRSKWHLPRSASIATALPKRASKIKRPSPASLAGSGSRASPRARSRRTTTVPYSCRSGCTSKG